MGRESLASLGWRPEGMSLGPHRVPGGAPILDFQPVRKWLLSAFFNGQTPTKAGTTHET